MTIFIIYLISICVFSIIISNIILLKYYKKQYSFIFINILINIFISIGIYIIASNKLYSNEIWNSIIKEIKYEEKWVTLETRTKRVYCGISRKGKSKYKTVTYTVHVSHGPYWNIKDSLGNTYSVSKNIYNKWKNVWKNEKCIGYNRGIKTGKIYKIYWNNKFETLYPHQSIHKYINKIRNSQSVFNQRKVSEKIKKQFPRYADVRKTDAIYGYGVDIDNKNKLTMNRVNAILGSKHQIHIITILFNKKYSRNIVDDILCSWNNMNKNELIIFIGINDNNNIIWCSVKSWLDNTTLHGIIQNNIINQQFNTNKLKSLYLKYIPKYWKRKQFKSFNYIQVHVHFMYYIIFVIIMIIFNISYIVCIKKYF